MFGFGFDVEVNLDGPFTKRHPLERVACGLVFLVFALFGNYLPLALAVEMPFAAVQNPHPPTLVGGLFVAGILMGMFLLGGFVLCLFIRVVSCGRLSGIRVLAAVSFVSLTVALLSAALDVWQPVFLASIGGILLCILLAGPIARIGQVLSKRRRADAGGSPGK